MMNKVVLGLVAAAALVVGTSSGQEPRPIEAGAQDPAVEIAELKRQVARLTADVNQLKQAAAQGGEAGKEMEAVHGYLENQAKAAAALQKVLVDSEEKGFTFGINPESREVLLAGFDEFAEVLQQDLPGVDAEE